jgi:1-acyl-sn-glycerol-3-phosphate acyltransferase
MWTAVVTVVFWAYVALTMPFFFLVALTIFVVTYPFDRNGKLLHLYTCFWGVQYIWCFPKFRLRIEGRENIVPGTAYVLASNHQSGGDIPVMFGLFKQFKFVSKAEIFKVPFLGWNMVLNRYVRLVRGQASSIGRMMATCRHWLDRGVSIMMFPEGTRSLDGRMLPFRLGAFTLAKDAGVPVVPIVLDGTLEALPKDGILRNSGIHTVRVKIGKPIASADYPDAEALRDAVQANMSATLAELRGQSVEAVARTRKPVPAEAAVDSATAHPEP